MEVGKERPNGGEWRGGGGLRWKRDGHACSYTSAFVLEAASATLLSEISRIDGRRVLNPATVTLGMMVPLNSVMALTWAIHRSALEVACENISFRPL